MTVAGWAWDPAPLLDTVARSSQADAVILLAAVGCIGLLFSLLALVGHWMDKRAWRRGIAKAHQPRPYDRERETA